LVLAAVAALGAAFWFLHIQLAGPDPLPQTLPTGEGDHEIVFLAPTTSASNWERFVAALRRTSTQLQQEMPLQGQFAGAYPPKSTDVAEVALAWTDSSRRLAFRWYKLTSNWKTADWVQALLRPDRQPPLAIIGGSSSESARELAFQLERRTVDLEPARRPVLILTTATADLVPALEEGPANGSRAQPSTSPPLDERVSLTRIYPGRTFRFCFSNRQMAVAITSFIWARDDLRPDRDPVHLVKWEDDSYSGDLIYGFLDALQGLAEQAQARDWAWLTGSVLLGGSPPLVGGIFPWDHCGRHGSEFRMSLWPTVQPIASSVGGFQPANRYEAQVANQVSKEMTRYKQQRRPLLVVTGQSQASRRFLKAVERLDPGRARRLVVATGDAISFNTVYRDRRIAWPIQDLPLALVFFCHYNPVDAAAGFQPAPEGVLPPRPPLDLSDAPPAKTPERSHGSTATGTEDVLLNADIIEALVRAFQRDNEPCADAAQLAERLATVRIQAAGIGFDPEAPLLFNPDGNRRSGTGEYVVCLRPTFDGERVLPRATLEVWNWQPPRSPGSGPSWRLCGEPFVLSYDPPPVEGGVSR